MLVRVTKSFKSIARESDLHPRLYNVGEVVDGYPARVALDNGWGEDAMPPADDDDDTALRSGEPSRDRESAAPADALRSVEPLRDRESAAPAKAAAPIKAKTTRLVDIEIDGERQRLAKGAIVEGELAERLIAAGHATRIADNKAKQIPETR